MITDFKNLFHSVRNINNGNPFFLQIPYGIKQMICLCTVQRGGGFIHNNQSCITGNRFDDFHHLNLCQSQIFHHRFCRIRHIKFAQQFLAFLILSFLIQQKSLCTLPFQKDTLCNRQIRFRIQLLMNHRNTGF